MGGNNLPPIFVFYKIFILARTQVNKINDKYKYIWL